MFPMNKTMFIGCIVLNLVFAGLNFYGGSVIWGLVNLGLAIYGLVTIQL